jgi:hypothetical protein
MIANNLIGTNAAGTAALGNGSVGLLLSNVQNVTVLNNVISANNVGFQLTGFGSAVEHNVIQGNLIGTDKTGKLALGNKELGMTFADTIGVTIGGSGAGQGNVIAFNGGNAIELMGGQQNLISRNSIFGNAGAGIKLDTDVTNDFATPPVLTFTPAGGGGTLSGTLTASPNLAYTIEIFSNPSAPTAGQEQGATFIQDVTVHTDGSGNGAFSLLLPAGFYTATATDPNGNTSEFSSAVGAHGLPATMTSVSSSLNPSTVGQQVTFTAIVTAPGFTGTPTGTVTFTIDGQAQTPVALSVVGGVDEAQFVTSTLTPGPHSVSAAYSGDTNLSPSSGSLPTQTVNSSNLPATTTTVSSSLNPSTVGQQVTFTAVVSPGAHAGTPAGTVTFTIDGQAQAPVPLSVVGGVDEARFVTSTLAAGQHPVSAAYSGDSSFAPSAVASPLVQVVRAHATTITAVSSANPSSLGQPVTFTATVTPGAGAPALTGSVTFIIDGKAQTPVPLELTKGGDRATLQISTLSAGNHTVTATYNGDAADSASSLVAPLVQTVLSAAVSAPTVTHVEWVGWHMHRKSLVLTFSTALDPVSATNRKNYVLVDSCGRIGFKSVNYDSSAHTVTLRPRQLINLHRHYRLTVNGADGHGVRGAGHVLLDGAGDGQPGTDFVTTLNWKDLVLPPRSR